MADTNALFGLYRQKVAEIQAYIDALPDAQDEQQLAELRQDIEEGQRQLNALQSLLTSGQSLAPVQPPVTQEKHNRFAFVEAQPRQSAQEEQVHTLLKPELVNHTVRTLESSILKELIKANFDNRTDSARISFGIVVPTIDDATKIAFGSAEKNKLIKDSELRSIQSTLAASLQVFGELVTDLVRCNTLPENLEEELWSISDKSERVQWIRDHADIVEEVILSSYDLGIPARSVWTLGGQTLNQLSDLRRQVYVRRKLHTSKEWTSVLTQDQQGGPKLFRDATAAVRDAANFKKKLGNFAKFQRGGAGRGGRNNQPQQALTYNRGGGGSGGRGFGGRGFGGRGGRGTEGRGGRGQSRGRGQQSGRGDSQE
jgi:hypothetical protein